MPKAKITYKTKETLEILKALAKYFDFEISVNEDIKKTSVDDIFIKGNRGLNLPEVEG